MDARLVSLADVDSCLAARWRALEDVAEVQNPFYGVDYLTAAARHLPDAKRMQLLIGESSTGLGWLVPVVPSGRLGKVPMVPGLRNRWPHVFFGHPLVAPGSEAAAARHVLAHLSGARGAHWLRLQHLDADNEFTRVVLEGLPASSVHLERYSRGSAIRRAESTYLDGHSNLRRLQRKRRAYERETGESISVVDRSDELPAIEEFLVLEASGWKGRNGGAFLNTAWDADFLREVADTFRARGRLRLWSLQSGGETLAMKMNLLTRDVVFCYLIAYDERVACLSPGLQLEVDNFRLFHSDPGLRFMDSCADPANDFVNRLYPERREMLNMTVGSGPIGRAVASLAAYSRGRG